MSRTGLVGLGLACATAVACTALVVAGPIDPPAGAVGPTYKTLAEVEPRIAINATNTPGDADSVYRITQSGSYYLTGDVAGVPSKHAIEIAADGVTIDGRGFGVVGVASALQGVTTVGVPRVRVRVHDVSISAFAQGGIALAGTDLVVERCQVRISGVGIRIGSGRVAGCTVGGGTAGIVAEGSSVVESCVAEGTFGSGIVVEAESTIARCVARGHSVHGIYAARCAVITDCIASENDLVGIFAAEGSTVSSCAARDNGDIGIRAERGSIVTGCTAAANGTNGIYTSAGCIVRASTAFANTENGVEVGTGCLVEACTARENGDWGIQTASAGTIRGNNCRQNGSAAFGGGIRVEGSDTRVEENMFSASLVGVRADGSTNIFLRNTCAGNTTNWALAANNIFGSIIDRSGVAAPAVSGSAAAGNLATSDPGANFSH